MKKQNQTIGKSKLSDLRNAHGVTVLNNLKVIRGALLQTPPELPNVAK